MTLALIDYGAGNLHSVHNALKAAGGDATITADADGVRRADRIVLPGVGAFAACMAGLTAIPGMVGALRARVLADGVPFLGVCVGMQLLADEGHEHGVTPGLGWVPGKVVALTPTDPSVRVPHMGWNDVLPTASHPLVEPGEAYFLHSYQFDAADPAQVIATTDHGGPVVAAVGRDNVLGVQFHPEKSQRYGIALLERFLAWRR
ncbi:imidazole glycerol phosphate synthase subunit HisH [Sphingomonas aestuarii]